MDLNAQKEEFSYAYIHAIASAAGCTFGLASRQIDREGIDAFLSADRPGGKNILAWDSKSNVLRLILLMAIVFTILFT
jgi:hypothetical protein